MTAITNFKNLRQYKNRFSLIVEKIPVQALTWSKYDNNFQANFVTIFQVIKFNVLIWIDRSILKLKLKQFYQILYSNEAVKLI